MAGLSKQPVVALSRFAGGKRQLLVASRHVAEVPTVAVAFERLYCCFLLIVGTAAVVTITAASKPDEPASSTCADMAAAACCAA